MNGTAVVGGEISELLKGEVGTGKQAELPFVGEAKVEPLPKHFLILLDWGRVNQDPHCQNTGVQRGRFPNSHCLAG